MYGGVEHDDGFETPTVHDPQYSNFALPHTPHNLVARLLMATLAYAQYQRSGEHAAVFTPYPICIRYHGCNVLLCPLLLDPSASNCRVNPQELKRWALFHSSNCIWVLIW